MFTLIFYSILITILTIPFATYMTDVHELTIYKYSKDIIYGFIIISFLALLINFFFPLNIYINSLIPLISLILFFKFKKIFLNSIFLKFLIFQTILISILIINSNVYRPDAGLYHLPYIGILNSEKIIIGLTNLHFRYGHTSIIQYFSAVSNNFIFKDNGIIFAQAIIASAVIINFTVQIFNYNKNKKYNVHFFFLLFILIYISYKMNRYSEYGNDAPAHFLLFFLISEIIKYGKFITYKQYGNQLILSLFIVLNKITLIFLILLNFVNLKKINLNQLIFDKRTIFIFFFFTIWILKNVLVSGCAIYPLKFTCIEKLSWTNIEDIEKVQIEGESWAKGFSNQTSKNKLSHEQFLKNFNWLNSWSSVHFKLIIKILTPYLLFLFFIITMVSFKNTKSDKKIEKSNYIYLLIIFICCLIWFLKSPLYRYGFSFIVSFLSLLFAIYCSHFNSFKNLHSKFFKSILIIIILVIPSKNMFRIFKTDTNYFNSPWPKFYSMNKKNNITIFDKINIGGLNIVTPTQGYCMYVKDLCSHYKIGSNIEITNTKSFKIITKN